VAESIGRRLAKRARLVTEMEAGRQPPPASGPEVPELEVPPASTGRSGERLRRAIPQRLETDNEPTVLDPVPVFPQHVSSIPPIPAVVTPTRVSSPLASLEPRPRRPAARTGSPDPTSLFPHAEPSA
jgi:hypothetical protein